MIKINVSTIGDMYVHDHEIGSEVGMANYELFVVDFLMKNVKEDSNFMDIGGYEGYFILLMGQKIKKGTIYTFEPCNSSYEIIKKNIEIYSLNNVKLFHSAVTDKTSPEVLLTWRPGAQCVSRIFEFPPGVDNNTQSYERVPTVCLDDFEETKIDLMKIDIEGGEVELFQGSKKFFSRNRDCKIVLELHCGNIKHRGINVDKFVESVDSMFNFYNFYNIKVDKKELIDCLNTNFGTAHYIFVPK